MKNIYSVEARFERTRSVKKVEFWRGEARNLSIATRRAIKDIMSRKNIRRLRHCQVVFHIEKEKLSA